jgi:hypothetical protein
MGMFSSREKVHPLAGRGHEMAFLEARGWRKVANHSSRLTDWWVKHNGDIRQTREQALTAEGHATPDKVRHF